MEGTKKAAETGGVVASQKGLCPSRIEMARLEYHVGSGESSLELKLKRTISCDTGAMSCVPGVAPGAMVIVILGRAPESNMVEWAFQLYKPNAACPV